MFQIMNVIALILSGATALLAFYSFFRERIKRGIWIAGVAILLSAVSFMLYQKYEEDADDERQAQREQQMLMRDAKQVSKAIVISGWEDDGDYIGYLSQIVGFYQRHAHKYQSELATYQRQLGEWQDHIKAGRQSNADLTVTQQDNLQGLVSAGERHLERIAEGDE